MERRQKIVVGLVALLLAGGIFYFTAGRDMFRKQKSEPIKINNGSESEILPVVNDGPVSPISGLSCDNWNRRPLAVMQASDVTARPDAGFSQADMVIEMPVITASVTRLMGIYICNTPEEVGSMRSSRHDFIPLAKGFDAIFAHWGGSHFAIDVLNQNVIDNLDCNNNGGKYAGKCCFRKEGMDRGVDSGYARPKDLLACAQEFGYRMEGRFSGYPHQQEVAMDSRPQGGRLRVAFAGPFEAEYEYDKESNSYKRIWGNNPDIDRNNKERIAPKNVVVMMAASEQIEGQYNNVQLGDPWYDTSDSGEAFYYLNGKEYRGTWKKDKSKIDSKLFFYDEAGKEMSFVPGQIWVEVLEPGQTLKWYATN